MSFDSNKYMNRVKDREVPIPRDSSLLLQPMRPDPVMPSGQAGGHKKPVTIKSFLPLPLEEQEELEKEYYRLAALPATNSLTDFPQSGVTEVVSGKAWVVSGLLNQEECREIIRRGDGVGMTVGKSPDLAPRTSRRTNDYHDPWITRLVGDRLPEELMEKVEATLPFSAVRGVHSNWRVACYGPGQTFPAHWDQSDAITVAGEEEGTKELCTSSHTLLIYLSPPEDFSGGATRLFLSGKYDQDTLDIRLPQGCALIFQQKGMLHAGLEVKAPGGGDSPGCKYIAQAGLLRGQSEIRAAPSLNKLGPGLDFKQNRELKQMEKAGVEAREKARQRIQEQA